MSRAYDDGTRAYFAGCNMPSAKSIELADYNARVRAEASNEQFVDALRRYFEKGGRA